MYIVIAIELFYVLITCQVECNCLYLYTVFIYTLYIYLIHLYILLILVFRGSLMFPFYKCLANISISGWLPHYTLIYIILYIYIYSLYWLFRGSLMFPFYNMFRYYICIYTAMGGCPITHVCFRHWIKWQFPSNPVVACFVLSRILASCDIKYIIEDIVWYSKKKV